MALEPSPPAAVPAVTLTFDNGPEPGVTPHVLEVLERHGLRATFFVLGHKLAAHRVLAEQAHAAGHWIGNHTWSHARPFGQMQGAEAEEEIGRTQALIGDLAHPDKLFRPQGGGGALGPHLLNPGALRHLQDGGYSCVLWHAVPGDFRDPDGWPERALEQCAGRAHTVLVLHDLANGAMRHLDRFLTRLRQQARLIQEFPQDVFLLKRGLATRPLSGFVSDAAMAGTAP